jgi:2-polyprenyl-6-methoxyphenol hydroxylase-like FAD-dependent oxidoreductase
MPAGGRREHAIVIGGSMAGLALARALADGFERVTIVERDRLDGVARPRRGVPQGHHIHVLLARGALALEELFPGLRAELLAAGASSGDLLTAGRWYLNGRRLAAGRFGHDLLSMSRPFLEAHVQRRVRALPGVTIVDERHVRSLRTTADRRRVTGVRVTRKDGTTEDLPADLVVDCSGRHSRLPAWLEDLGYTPPPVTRLRLDLRYSTRQYRLPAGALGGQLFCAMGMVPDVPRAGVLVRIEDGRWLALLAGIAGERPPLDPAGFERFAATLVAPDVHDAIGAGAPLDDPRPFHYPEAVRHRYERLRRLPEGLLATGDAVGSFNPVYGQGMTVAALEALALRALLATGEPLSPLRWFRAIRRSVDVPWRLALSADLALPQVDGPRSPAMRLGVHYLSRLHATAAHDATLGAAFFRVAGLLDPPQRLFAPAVALRVLRGPGRAAAASLERAAL